MSHVPEDAEHLRTAVRDRYTRAVQTRGKSAPTQSSGCSSNSSCCRAESDAGTRDLYNQEELASLPQGAIQLALGCGNPTALAELKPGEHVLDLGSGGGIDVLLSARRVGPDGFVYGLDMTDAMLEEAEHNRAQAGGENVQFLKGIMEAIPLPERTVDVVISNCVINLAADKGRVLREAYRVLKPAGRFAVSDVVLQGQVSEALRTGMEAWAGCVAGDLEEETYRCLLTEAGFEAIEIEVTHHYSVQDLSDWGEENPLSSLSEAERAEIDGKLVSAFVRARKPG